MELDTIFAVATAPGRSGVAVIRISGTRAREAAEALVGPLPGHGRSLRKVTGRSGAIIDEGLVLTFAEGQSYTGEATAELQLHGSAAVLAAVLAELGARDGCRLAEAGEFSRRAMENGRLDLAQAEGLADLLDAETEVQRLQAMRVFSGGLSHLSETWRRDLLRAAALLEATIDFADEDVPVDVAPEVLSLLGSVRASLTKEATGVPVAERVREGFEVAIVGRPNVGKSTLLNRLVGRDAALTSQVAGTTRDIIEVRVDIAGLPVTFLDTAGLREGTEGVEALGIARGRERAMAADLRVHILEAGEAPPVDTLADDIVVVGKRDVDGSGSGVSGLTGAGVDVVVQRIGAILSGRVASVGGATQQRHRARILEATAALDRATSEMLRHGPAAEIVAADVRTAIRSIGALVGRIDVEDVLGEIFSRFCIGK